MFFVVVAFCNIWLFVWVNRKSSSVSTSWFQRHFHEVDACLLILILFNQCWRASCLKAMDPLSIAGSQCPPHPPKTILSITFICDPLRFPPDFRYRGDVEGGAVAGECKGEIQWNHRDFVSSQMPGGAVQARGFKKWQQNVAWVEMAGGSTVPRYRSEDAATARPRAQDVLHQAPTHTAEPQNAVASVGFCKIAKLGPFNWTDGWYLRYLLDLSIYIGKITSES